MKAIKKEASKKMLVLLLGLGVVLGLSYKLIVLNVHADSGFDSSYSSGSSSSSHSSSSSSSSSSHRSSSGGSGSGSVFYTYINIIVVIIIYIVLVRKGKAKYGSTGKKNSSILLDHTKECDCKELEEIIPKFNKEEFLQNRYLDYVEIQKAWMNFDYDMLRKKVTDELYNQYSMQLDTLKVKNQQNIMADFVYKDAMITNIKKENDCINTTIELTTEFIDYIDEQGKPVRGSNSQKIIMHYEITFVSSLKKTSNTCPNCGAKVEDASSKKCTYCGSVIVGVSTHWVMSKKEAKGQLWK